MKSSYSLTLFKTLFFLVSIIPTFVSTSFANMLPYTFILSINITIIVTVFFLKPLTFRDEDKNLIWPIILFLAWNIITIIRGIFVAENYWEWKFLVSSGLVMLMPLTVYIFTNKSLVQQILSFWLKYVFFLFLLLIPFATSSGFYGMYFAPILILLLLIPLLPFRWKIIVLFGFVLVLMTGFDSRSNIIRFSMATFLGLLYYFRAFISLWMFKLLHSVFMILPIILLLLGLMNIFNIFKMNEYIKGNYTVTSSVNNKKESLTVDTRTFLYAENIHSALKNHYVLFGRTPANGYDSKWFGNYLKFFLHTGKLQRFTSEVAILNIFLWGGIVGVILYFLVFFWASYLAIYRSNNYFIKIIGMFVAFRWSYAFVEDFAAFEIQYIVLWMLISMCYSTEFRKMSDMEFALWVMGIFSKKSIGIRVVK